MNFISVSQVLKKKDKYEILDSEVTCEMNKSERENRGFGKNTVLNLPSRSQAKT